VITSKNQKPKPDWLKIVVTHRAKLKIRAAINEERRKEIEKGRNIFDKMLTGTKRLFTENDAIRAIRKHGIKTPADLFSALANQQISSEEVMESITRPHGKGAEHEGDVQGKAPHKEFAEIAREVQERPTSHKDEVIIAGMNNIAYSYAKCCNPVPGDDIIGFVTTEGAVKIHRKNCFNVTNENSVKSERIVSVAWNRKLNTEFLAGIRIVGEDKVGMTNQITGVISKFDTNIRTITLHAKDGIFVCNLMIFVKNTDKLTTLMDKLKKVQGVFTVERMSA